MQAEFDSEDEVVLVTGASGALGSAVAEAFVDAGATVCGADLIEPGTEDSLIDPGVVDSFYQGDFTEKGVVENTIGSVMEDHGRLDALCNIAGTWRGGDPLAETDVEEFEFLLDVNLKTMFLASKHAIPHLAETGGAIVSVSSRSSLEGGSTDGTYRATKAGVRILTETIAEENEGDLRANAIMPSVIDTPMNREMMSGADYDAWPDPADIAEVVLFLCSDAAGVTNGAAVPVYGEV